MEPRFGFDVYKTSVKLFEKHPLQIFLLGLAYLLFIFVCTVAPLLVQIALAFVAVGALWMYGRATKAEGKPGIYAT